MKVKYGRTYLDGEERDAAAALEDRAFQILGRLMISPPAKRPPRGRKASEPTKRTRKAPPRITGVSAWCPFGPDGPGIPIKLDTKATKAQIEKAVRTIFPDGPMADDLLSFLLEANGLSHEISKIKAPAVLNAWFGFLMSKEGTEMAGIPIPQEPVRIVTLPKRKGVRKRKPVRIPPPHHPPSDEAIVSITESLLYEMGIKIKHSVLRQYLDRFHKAKIPV